MKRAGREPVFWAVLGTLVLQLWLCGFFSLGAAIPMTGDTHLANYPWWRFHFPPQCSFNLAYWLGSGTSPQALDPLTLLAHLPAWLFFTVMYPLFGSLAVLTLHTLARELGFGKGASTLGGLAWGWQGMLVGNIASGHFAPGPLLAILPLAVWAALRTVRERSWAWAAVCGGLTGTMVTLMLDRGGLASVLVGMFFGAAAGFRDRGQPAAWLGHAGRLGVVVAVALMISFAQFRGVFRTQIAGTQMGSSEDPAQKYAWATQWSLPPEEGVIFVAPGFLGWRTGFPQGPYWGRVGRSEEWSPQHPQSGFRNFQIDIVTLGTIPFLLALVGIWGLWRRNDDDPAGAGSAEQRFIGRFFAVGWVVCVLLALGKYAPFFKWVYALPYMDAWRSPLKFITPGNFCLAVLGVYGVDELARLAVSGEGGAVVRGLVKRALWFVPGALGACLAMAMASPDFFAGGMAGEGYSEAEVGAAISTMRQSLFVAAGAALLLALAVRDWFSPERARQRQWASARVQKLWTFATEPGRMAASAAVFAGIVTAAQMCWVLSHYVDLHDARKMYGMNALIRHLKGTGEPVRVKVFSQDPVLHNLLSRVFPYHGIACLDVPATSRTPEDYAEFFAALQKNPLRLWDLAGIKYLAAPAQIAQAVQQQIPGFGEAMAAMAGYRMKATKIDNVSFDPAQPGTPASHVVFDMKRFLPKASVVPAIEVMPDKAALLKRLADPSWDPRRSVLATAELLREAGVGGGEVPGSATGVAVLRRYDGRRIDVAVRCDAPAVLLIDDKFDTDWRATLNGQGAGIFRADHVLRGVVVPAGESRVVLDYRPPIGAVYVNLLGWCVVGAAAWGLARRRG